MCSPTPGSPFDFGFNFGLVFEIGSHITQASHKLYVGAQMLSMNHDVRCMQDYRSNLGPVHARKALYQLSYLLRPLMFAFVFFLRFIFILCDVCISVCLLLAAYTGQRKASPALELELEKVVGHLVNTRNQTCLL